ncbi:MAG: heme lyase CcmF/NrfE family subunit [Rhodospirillaceae bacterium]|nr:heme lyase CcmF/NrfE family subunit [Rhodospirillaceae bacterium]
MIPELGHYALVLALLVAAMQSVVPLMGAARGNGPLMASAVPMAQSQFILVATAFAALTYAYVTSDFTVANVAANSHSAKPLLYKISGVWGNHEGSLLLWVLILTLFGAAVASFGANLPPALRARVLAVQAMIGVGFLAFLLFTSNPFLRLDPAPVDGRGLNPLLQDPGLAFHPPFLYLGYVGFSMAFSFAVAALIEGRVDAAWARWVRPWTLAAWGFLTVGIALGSWWAYYELGWGGFWFWDPVENASFMPWLVGTALLHSAIVVEKRDALKSWTILLAILTFGLSLIGTFLVRSGVLTSVHAFAVDPERGIFILGLLLLAIGGSLALYALRAPALKGGGLFKPVSREGAMVLNNLLLSVAAATVFLGTLYPLFLDIIGGGKISVGAPYFNATFVPLMVPVLAAVVVGPMLAWKRGDLEGVVSRLKFAFLAAVAAALAAVALAGSWHDALAALGIGLGVWAIAGTFVEWAGRIRLVRAPVAETVRRARGLPLSFYGMSIAHAALGVVVIGITASGAWQTEMIRAMRPGERANVAGYTLVFEGVREVRGPNYVAERGIFRAERGGRHVTVLYPEKRRYPVEGSSTTEAAIHTTLFADLYVVLGDGDGKGGWVVRAYHNPLVPWIWGGAIVMFFGGLVSLADRRHRVGAPRRQRAEAPAPQPV